MWDRVQALSAAFVLAATFAAPAATAQTRPASAPATRPTTAPADDAGRPLRAVVKEVEGVAQRRLPGPGNKWVTLKVGDQLDEKTIVRTGFRTRVVLSFTNRSEIIIQRATKFGINEYRQAGPVTRARLGIKYGSIRATVEKARGLSDFRITTPVSTLAITGTSGDLSYTADFGYRILCDSGTWISRMGQRTWHVRATEQADSSMTRNVDIVKAAAIAQIGDAYGGLSRLEKASLLDAGSGRGGIGFGSAGTGAGSTITSPKAKGPTYQRPRTRSSHLGPPKIVPDVLE